MVTILNIFLISIYTSKLMKGNFQQHFKQVDAVVCCMFQFSSPLQERRAWFYVQTKDSCNVCLWYMCRYCTSKSRRWMFFLWILHLSRGSSFTTFLFRVKYTNLSVNWSLLSKEMQPIPLVCKSCMVYLSDERLFNCWLLSNLCSNRKKQIFFFYKCMLLSNNL